MLDPPELKWGEAHLSQANTTHCGTVNDGSVMVVKSANMDDSMLSRYSAIAKREMRRQEEMYSYQLATTQTD